MYLLTKKTPILYIPRFLPFKFRPQVFNRIQIQRLRQASYQIHLHLLLIAVVLISKYVLFNNLLKDLSMTKTEPSDKGHHQTYQTLFIVYTILNIFYHNIQNQLYNMTDMIQRLHFVQCSLSELLLCNCCIKPVVAKKQWLTKQW